MSRIPTPSRVLKTLMLISISWLPVGLLTVVDARDETAPPTRVAPATDVYHGVSVEDPYRWLENGSDPEVRAWVNAQTGHGWHLIGRNGHGCKGQVQRRGVPWRPRGFW